MASKSTKSSINIDLVVTTVCTPIGYTYCWPINFIYILDIASSSHPIVIHFFFGNMFTYDPKLTKICGRIFFSKFQNKLWDVVFDHFISLPLFVSYWILEIKKLRSNCFLIKHKILSKCHD